MYTTGARFQVGVGTLRTSYPRGSRVSEELSLREVASDQRYVASGTMIEAAQQQLY